MWAKLWKTSEWLFGWLPKRFWLDHNCRIKCEKGNIYLLQLSIFFGFVQKLPHCHKDGKYQSCCQNNEDATNVLYSKSTGIFAFLFWTTVSSPPFLLHHVQLAFLLQVKNGYSYFVSVGRSCRIEEGKHKLLKKVLTNMVTGRTSLKCVCWHGKSHPIGNWLFWKKAGFLC